MTTGPHRQDGADPQPGRRFRTFFVAVCVYIRERTGASTARIADLAGLKTSLSVDRFESGKNFPDKNFESYAAAYAYDADGMDPRELIATAVEWWQRYGAPPLTARQEADRDLAKATQPTVSEVLAAIRRAESTHAEGAQAPTSTRKRRGGAG